MRINIGLANLKAYNRETQSSAIKIIDEMIVCMILLTMVAIFLTPGKKQPNMKPTKHETTRTVKFNTKPDNGIRNCAPTIKESPNVYNQAGIMTSFRI